MSAKTKEKKSFDEKGTISVQMENIFPIIKKWLYSDKEIFLRELISNSIDAINKLRHLMVVGEAEKEEESGFQVEVKIDKEAGTLSIIDNGIGMTAEDIKRYINEVAFSGATEFMKKYKSGDEKAQVIGHFGLGFYSAFMVADKVEINTLSHQKDAQAARWVCEGSPEFEISAGDRTERGTEIKLYISKAEDEFLEALRIRTLIRKYCDFMPYPILLNGEKANKQKPLWEKNPSEVSKEEYLEFYQYLYPMSQEPYLWIHLNVEVPFHLKGILFFPRLSHEMDPTKGNIKLYSHHVFVSEHSEDFLPRFLVTLQGALDCPDITLNVSRSMLQNDAQVKQVSGYITKKVADRLKQLYKKEREFFLKNWEDIHVFVKVGIMEDDKFYEKVKDIVVFKTSGGEYVTLDEYLEKNKEKAPDRVYYASDAAAQSRYIEMFKSQGIEVLFLNTLIDTHFIQFLEFKNNKVKFTRVDSDISDTLIEKDKGAQIVDPKTNKTADEVIGDIFKKELDFPNLEIKVEHLKSDEVPALIILPEASRRMKEMTQFMQAMSAKGVDDSLFGEHILMVNGRNAIVQNLKRMSDAGQDEATLKMVCEHVYDLAMLAHQPLKHDKLEQFVKRSNKVLELMTEKS